MLAIPLSGHDGGMTVALAALTKSLARPVTCGLLPEVHAHAAIAAALARTTPASTDLAGQLKIWLHILEINIRNCEARPEEASGAIKRALRPMIASHQPWNMLQAEAHDLNGEANFPLAEAEVASLVKREVYFSLPAAPGRSHHGG